MNPWKPGDRARIAFMPERGRHLIGQTVTVVPTGGFDLGPNDVAVRATSGLLYLHADCLVPVDCERRTKRRIRGTRIRSHTVDLPSSEDRAMVEFGADPHCTAGNMLHPLDAPVERSLAGAIRPVRRQINSHRPHGPSASRAEPPGVVTGAAPAPKQTILAELAYRRPSTRDTLPELRADVVRRSGFLSSVSEPRPAGRAVASRIGPAVCVARVRWDNVGSNGQGCRGDDSERA